MEELDFGKYAKSKKQDKGTGHAKEFIENIKPPGDEQASKAASKTKDKPDPKPRPRKNKEVQELKTKVKDLEKMIKNLEEIIKIEHKPHIIFPRLYWSEIKLAIYDRREDKDYRSIFQQIHVKGSEKPYRVMKELVEELLIKSIQEANGID